MLNIMLALFTIIGVYLTYDALSQIGLSEYFDSSHYSGIDFPIYMLGLVASIICPIVLIIRNLKIKSIPHFIIYTILQFVLAIIVAIIYILFVIIGLLLGGFSNTSNSTSSTTHTYEEDQYAKANGYFDAQSANDKGFDTSQANNPGFDYNQKQ